MTNPKLLIVSLGILLLSIFETFGNTISGTVLLDNTSDHSGIKIAFEASSVTAESTEVYSDINGDYSLDVTSGVYKISYKKPGYQTVEVTDVFVSTDASLEEVVLTSKGLRELSGNVSGTWYADTTYVVVNNISLPQNLSLTIEPGTEIMFSDYYSFTVIGSLSAIGTVQDSILFTSGKETKDRGDWIGMLFNSTGESNAQYIIAEYAGVPKFNEGGIVHITNGVVNIEHSTFRHSPSVGIYAQSGYLSISNSEIYEIFEHGIRNKTNIDVTNNVIHDIEVVGINNYSNSNNIKGNLIYNSGYGIVTFFSSTVSNNIFYNNGSGIQVAYENPTITNNTFISNQEGIEIYNSGNGNPTLSNNIFFNNVKAVDNGNGNIPSTIYNLFNGNTSNFTSIPTGFGSIITTNGNGTDADTYLNIFDDPAFASIDILNEYFATLSESSPAINAGDPSIFDSNGTVVDLGAKPFFIVPEFSLITPQNNATLNVEPTTFHWEASSDLDPVSYSLFIFNNAEAEAFESIEQTSVEVDIENNLTPNQSYQWFVIATDGMDSTYSDTLNINIANILATDVADVQFKIYPNPVKQRLFIQGSTSVRYKVELKNLTGKILLSREMIEYTEFELNEYSKGIYIISILNEESGKIYSNRIILE